MLSGRGFHDELITLPEESYQPSCIVCNLDASRSGGHGPHWAAVPQEKRIITVHHAGVFVDSDSCTLVIIQDQTHAHMGFFFLTMTDAIILYISAMLHMHTFSTVNSECCTRMLCFCNLTN